MQRKILVKLYVRMFIVVLSPCRIMYAFYFPLNTFPISQTVCNILFFTIRKKKKIKEEKKSKEFGLCPEKKTESLQFPESQACLCYSWLVRIVEANEVTHCGSLDNFRMVRLERPFDERVGALGHLISA